MEPGGDGDGKLILTCSRHPCKLSGQNAVHASRPKVWWRVENGSEKKISKRKEERSFLSDSAKRCHAFERVVRHADDRSQGTHRRNRHPDKHKIKCSEG